MFANSDFSDLLSLFNANNVRYLIIGGYAVIQYAEPRYTKELAERSSLRPPPIRPFLKTPLSVANGLVTSPVLPHLIAAGKRIFSRGWSIHTAYLLINKQKLLRGILHLYEEKLPVKYFVIILARHALFYGHCTRDFTKFAKGGI